jgi:dTDP-4-dehydrorhamnose reductase
MKIAIIGASGQVGHQLMVQGAKRGHQVAGTRCSFSANSRLKQLDLANEAETAAFVKSAKPEVVFCTAAWSHVDGCQTDPEKGHRLNVENTLHAAKAAFDAKARFVWYSSDYVFPGVGPIYSEASEPRPLSKYGEMKLEGERAVLALAKERGAQALIIRTAVVYGPEQQRKNTIYQLVRASLEEKPFLVPVDQVCNPTYSPNLAAASLELAEKGASGILHVAGTDIVSRYDFAMMACMMLKLDEGVLEPVTTDEGKRPAPRPLMNALDVSKAQGLLRVPLMGCAEGLAAFQMEAPPVAAVAADLQKPLATASVRGLKAVRQAPPRRAGA